MKRLLVLNFFPAFVPPSSGGELRYFNLYYRLSEYFDVTLLSPTYSHHPRETVTHSPHFREYRIPKEPVHDQLHREIAKESIAPEFSALVCALAGRYPNAYHDAYLELQRNADVIIHESPYLLEYDFLFGLDGKPRIYNSYNVESDLVEQVWKGSAAERYIDYITDLEARLVVGCNHCFAVSEVEAERLATKFGVAREKISIAPNGITPGDLERAALPDSRARRPKALFFGSFHPPNIEAAQFILSDLAPQCPDIDFIIAGSCLERGVDDTPPNVEVLGRVSDPVRRELFAIADMALNPMFSGAGTNLKALEYLAAGIPMVATELGARGLDLVNGEHVLLADRKSFADTLLALTRNRSLQEHLAANGVHHAMERFSWGAIACGVRDQLESIIAARQARARKKILVLNDFSAANPTAGGEIRINRLYSELSNFYNVILLCFSASQEIRWQLITPHFLEIGIPKTPEHLKAEHSANCQFHVSVNDIISYQYAPRNQLLVALAHALYAICDVVVLTHPYMVSIINGLEGKLVIYESLNAECLLKQSILRGHPQFDQLLDAVRECESQAVRKSRAVVTVSAVDHQPLVELGADPQHLFLVRNGVNVPAIPYQHPLLPEIRKVLQSRLLILFIGSAHMPNVEAADFVCTQLAPALPQYLFGIVGSVCDKVLDRAPQNVLLFGRLDETTKDVVIEIADLAINPVISGSGSNLKLAEYFAKGLPTVTTPCGARGYEITPGKEAVVCELEQFATEISRLLADPDCRQILADNAYQYVHASLDWTLLAAMFRRILEQEVLTSGKKRLLIVTYRFTDPPLGGGEVYLLELLRQLDRLGDFFIDVATLDIVTIENQFHFSSKYSLDINVSSPRDLANLTVYRFRTDVLPDNIRLHNARKLFATWMEEFRQTSLRHLDKYSQPMLLGGWYFPERTASGFEVWSSNRALVFVNETDAITIKGYVPSSRLVTISAASDQLFQQTVQGDFAIQLNLSHHKVIAIEVDATFATESDPRSLGIRFQEIRYRSKGETASIRLDYDYRMFLKSHYPGLYIEDLIEAANNRSSELDALFQETRGPNSKELDDWLTHNAANYDVIFGHSVPFNTLILATKHARAAHKPLIHIPHFHVDDEYYHWRCYYEALAAADDVITSPRTATALFFKKIGAKSTYLPYGIHAEEHPSAEDEQQFHSLYSSSLPYILILGRKDRAKNYDVTIEAVSILNKQRRLCNVVMIGRDEDGLALPQSEVIYLGGQPRGIVLAALKNAVCLVSMSDSESFGIVILEAWAQKRPVIVSKTCIASVELVDEGINGLLASKETLPKKILYYLEHPDAATAMGQTGYDKVRREFTWEAIAEQLNTILLNLARSSVCRLTGVKNNSNIVGGVMIPDYEAMLEAFYGRLLKPGDVVADVGAHVGRHTVPMLKNVLPLGHVYAFEPLPECWAALTENECLRAHHENVTISQCALGAENATRDFVVAVDIPAYSGLQERHYDAPTRLERISVEVKRMDSVLCKINRLDYIKVDAEGGEFDILVGAEETLSRLGPVISFEFGLNSCQGYGVTPEHMFDYLQHSGYLIFDILGQALDREAFSNSAIQQALWDYVALPEAKQELSGLLNRT